MVRMYWWWWGSVGSTNVLGCTGGGGGGTFVLWYGCTGGLGWGWDRGGYRCSTGKPSRGSGSGLVYFPISPVRGRSGVFLPTPPAKSLEKSKLYFLVTTSMSILSSYILP